MRDVGKDVIETLPEEELTDHLGFEKYDPKAKTVDPDNDLHNKPD
jgi:hypothetical protein